jgi:dihydrodipicolinate synthase/N-acetylneuraminate lyase
VRSAGTGPLTGIVAAAVTPFTSDGEVDVTSWRRLLEWLAEAGVHGVYACGTTGESPFLRPDERVLLAEEGADALARSGVQLAVHVGAATTKESVALARRCAGAADALAVVTPAYYTYPEGLVERHFAAVLEAASDRPVYLYNLPGYTGNSFGPDLVLRLRARHPNVAGVKDSSKDFDVTDSFVASGVDTLSGTDGQIAPALLAGAAGAVSAVAGCAPTIVLPAWRAHSAGDLAGLARAHRAIVAERTRLKRGAPIVPYKERLAAEGVIASAAVRGPLGDGP